MLSSGTAKQTDQRKVFDVAELVVAALPAGRPGTAPHGAEVVAARAN